MTAAAFTSLLSAYFIPNCDTIPELALAALQSVSVRLPV